MLRHLIRYLGYISHALLQYHIPHGKTGHLKYKTFSFEVS